MKNLNLKRIVKSLPFKKTKVEKLATKFNMRKYIGKLQLIPYMCK